MKRITALITAMMLLICLLAGCQDAVVAATVALESGSSAELTVNDETLAQDIDAAIAAMIASGALNAEENTVLATVTDEKLAENVLKYIGEAFTKNEFAGAAICQYAQDAKQGKAQLVQALVAANDTYATDELQTLSIHMLNLLAEGEQIEGLLRDGTASREALIDEDSAIDVALYYVNTDRDSVKDLAVALAYNEGLLYYNVLYTMGGKAQEAFVDAASGELLYSGEVGGDMHEFQAEEPFTEENAIAVACVYVGVDVTAAKDVVCKFVDHANPPYFDITFTHNGTTHHVIVAATTGMVLESEAPEETTPVDANGDISAIPEDTQAPVIDDIVTDTEDMGEEG